MKRLKAGGLQHPAARGQAYTADSYLSGLVSGDFSDSVTTGRRAVTIKVDNINSMDGMLRPGNHIDIMVGMSSEQAGLEPSTGKEQCG